MFSYCLFQTLSEQNKNQMKRKPLCAYITKQMYALYCNIGCFFLTIQQILDTMSNCRNVYDVQTVLNMKYLWNCHAILDWLAYVICIRWSGIEINIKLICVHWCSIPSQMGPCTSNAPFRSLTRSEYSRFDKFFNCPPNTYIRDAKTSRFTHRLCDSNTIGYWLAWNVSIDIVPVYSNKMVFY